MTTPKIKKIPAQWGDKRYIIDYNKKTQKVIKEANQKPHKSKSFKNTEELYKDLRI